MFIVELLLLVFEKMLVAFFFCIENNDSFESVVEIKDGDCKIKVKIKKIQIE